MIATPDTRWFSLKRRLLGWLLIGTSLGWTGVMGFTYVNGHREIDTLFDAQMVQQAQTLLVLAGEYDDDDDIAHLEPIGHKYQQSLIFQLWDDEGHLLLRSAHAPQTPLTIQNGFSESSESGKPAWRYYSQWDNHRQLRAIVGEAHVVRENLSGQIAHGLLLPALTSIPLLGAWIWFVTWGGFRPLNQIAAALKERNAENLEPLRPQTAPNEIRPLVDAVNSLLDRLAHSLEKERRFTADAAHELRMPLAAMVTQAQVAHRSRDSGEREHALAQIEISGQRAARLIEQLLTLARLDPALATMPSAPVRLDRLAAEVCAELGAAALARNINLELDAPGSSGIDGYVDLLRALLRNLLDNAVRYTPEGGTIVVSLAAHQLRIADSGPGIPEAQREVALKRFRRLTEQSTEGSGLGLAIVARIAELHGMALRFADNKPGLIVELGW